MNTTKPTRHETRADKIIELMGDRALSHLQIADLVRCGSEPARVAIRLLRAQKRLYISGYTQTFSAPSPLYKAGDLPDAVYCARVMVEAMAKRIMDALKKSDQTSDQIKAIVGTARVHREQALVNLRASGQVHVCSLKGHKWTYRIGPAPDAPATKPRKPERRAAPRPDLPPQDPLMAALFRR